MCWVKELKDPWRYTWAKLMLIRSIPTVVDTQIGKSNGKSLFNNNYRKLFPFVNKFPHVKNKRTENIYIYIPILNPLEPNLKKKKRGRGGFERRISSVIGGGIFSPVTIFVACIVLFSRCRSRRKEGWRGDKTHPGRIPLPPLSCRGLLGWSQSIMAARVRRLSTLLVKKECSCP